MALNDIFNKGIDLINKGATTLKEAAKEKKNAIDEFNLLITRSDHLKGMVQFEAKNLTPSVGREQKILGMSLTINVNIARIINSLIPIEETICFIKTAKEVKTELEYWFIITDKKLWIANRKEYTTHEFEDIKICEIVNKSVMTQYTNFNENAFAFDGSESDISKMCNILTNREFRKNVIDEQTTYLCGITPKIQFLNQYYTGMSIGTNDEIVFHNGKAGNKRVQKDDIDHIQLLMDNSVVMTKCKNDLQNIISNLSECRKMTLKVVLKNEIFLLDIIPQNLMGTIIKREDSIFQTNYNFALEVMNKISEILGR